MCLHRRSLHASVPCFLQEIIEAEVARFYQKLVVAGTAFGELCHPGYTCETYKELHLAAVSHQASRCRSAWLSWSEFWHPWVVVTYSCQVVTGMREAKCVCMACSIAIIPPDSSQPPGKPHLAMQCLQVTC